MGHLIGVLIGKFLSLIAGIIMIPFYILGVVLGKDSATSQKSNIENVILNTIKVDGTAVASHSEISIESIKSYAIESRALAPDQDDEDDIVSFFKIVNGIQYKVIATRGRMGGTVIHVNTPRQQKEYMTGILGEDHPVVKLMSDDSF